MIDFILDTTKLPKCSKCGKDMYLRTYHKLPPNGLPKKEIQEIARGDALLFKCDGDGYGGCGKHMLICETGKVYEHDFAWNKWKLIGDYTKTKEKVVFT